MRRYGVLVLALLSCVPQFGNADVAERPGIARSFAPPGGEPAPDTSPGKDAPQLSERSTLDQPDATGESSTHLIYFVPAGSPDDGLDTNGAIANSMRSARAWFVRETGSRRPRIDTLTTGGFDITYVPGKQAAAAYTSLDVLVTELKEKGFSGSAKRYLIYAAVKPRDGVCGEAYYPVSPLPYPGGYAVVYLDSAASCGGRNFGGGTVATSGRADTIAMHEWLHNEGVAPMTAPHYCATILYHICTGPLWMTPSLDPEATDIVFPYITAELSKMKLDRDHDDYYGHDWPWLADLHESAWLEPA